MNNNSIVTYRGVAHPWLCDAMGHLNTRHYVGMFDDAGLHFLNELGFNWTHIQESAWGWVDARNLLEYHLEVTTAALVTIRSCVRRLGNKSTTLFHEMRSTETDELHATMEVILVCFDKNVRKSMSIPSEFRTRAEKYLSES